MPIPTVNLDHKANLPQHPNDLIDTLYENLAFAEGLVFRINHGRQLTDDATLDTITWEVLADHRYSNSREVLWRTPTGGLLRGYLGAAKNGAFYIAEKTAAERDAMDVYVQAAMPIRTPAPDKEEVNFTFWSLTPDGPRPIDRTLSVAAWEKVAHNYTSSTRAELDKLMVKFRPSRAGQLVLWHSEPGTGKTHAIRALAWEWRKWCTFHYITDPETFFGGNASYMLNVLLLQGGNSPGDDEDNSDPSKWRLLILEDSGELMVPDAKAQTGQGLSRLLNVVDGLIGQGLKVMVLVTTNEVLKKLHPAVARPGRCAARIEFSLFNQKEAAGWLNTKDPMNGHVLPPFSSLADLYALSPDHEQITHETKEQKVGFTTTSRPGPKGTSLAESN